MWNENRYLLVASSKGGVLFFEGRTKKEVLMMFDTQYHRKGFILEIRNRETEICTYVKRTYR